MSQYYDKGKFSGSTPSQPPPPRKNQDDWNWIKWPLLIILFSSGIWPLAIALIVLSSRKKKKDRAAAAAQKSRESLDRVESALREAEERITRAMEQVERRDASGRRTAASEVLDRRRGQATRSDAQVNTAPRREEQPASEEKNQQEKKPAEKKQKIKGTRRAKLLRVLGICTLVIGAILCLDGIPAMIQGDSAMLEQIVAGAGFLASGGIMWGRGEYLGNLSRRTQRYILAIGAAETMSIDEIAKRVNRTPNKAAKELQKLIDKGYLGDDAYIDYESGCFARFGAAPVEKKEKVVVNEKPEEGYSAILREFRIANDRIPDEELSAKIERLEQISRLIFKEVEEHPEKRSRIHTFFDYYLPTTQKLLDTYAEFDEMGVEGENVSQAKVRIREMMDAIVDGFAHQLDQLYSADAMEVVSDIKVMETMLNRDTASAARDFGYDRAVAQKEKEEKPLQQLEL